MAIAPTSFDSDAVDGTRRHIIRMKSDGSGKQEMVDAHWGTNPRFSGGIEYRFVRAEGQTFPRHRCLLFVSEFRMKVGKKDYRVTRDDGNHFYLAGVWEPPMAEWPLTFRIITVAANAEVSRYQDRHGAIVERRQAMGWLTGTIPEDELLVTPHAHMLIVEEVGTGRPSQRALAL
jgi:putative SOS response-associated peptidase YedK